MGLQLETRVAFGLPVLLERDPKGQGFGQKESNAWKPHEAATSRDGALPRFGAKQRYQPKGHGSLIRTSGGAIT